jgi:hypothetical protein
MTMAFDGTKPADNQTIAAGPADIRENQRALKEDKIVNAQKVMDLSPGNASGNIPVANGNLCVNLNAEKLGGSLASAFATAGHTHGVATTSSNGLMCNTDKAKLNGIATGAEVNQNAFSNVLVGTTTIQADGKTDTLELAAGANISLTPDATNDRVTIEVSGTIPNADTVDGKHAGDFAQNFFAPDGVDLDTLIDSGMYRLNDETVNGPPGVSLSWSQLLVIHGARATIAQIAVQYSLGKMFVRSGNPPQVGGTGKWTVWKELATVDGTVANANALGNLDVGQFVRALGEATGDWNNYRRPGMYMVNEWINKSNYPTGAYSWGTLVVFRGHNADGGGVGQLYLSHGGSQMWYRGGNATGGWQTWKQIATVDGNVATASKLQTPRNINGVPFDGTSDISIPASGDTRFQICGNGCNDAIPNLGPNCLNLSYLCLSKLDTSKALYLKRLRYFFRSQVLRLFISALHGKIIYRSSSNCGDIALSTRLFDASVTDCSLVIGAMNPNGSALETADIYREDSWWMDLSIE